MQTQVKSTLLDLVRTLNSFTDDDHQVVSMVTYLVNSGHVCLCGNFAGATIELSPSSPTTPQPNILLS
jgi:hypothetical protein